MKWSNVVASVAVVAAAMPAAAETIASPPIYGGRGQDHAYCYVFNASETTSMPIQSIDFWADDEFVTGAPLDNCKNSSGKAVLPPASGCYGYAAISNTKAYSCIVSLTGKANARSSIEVVEKKSGRVLNRADLR